MLTALLIISVKINRANLHTLKQKATECILACILLYQASNGIIILQIQRWMFKYKCYYIIPIFHSETFTLCAEEKELLDVSLQGFTASLWLSL